MNSTNRLRATALIAAIALAMTPLGPAQARGTSGAGSTDTASIIAAQLLVHPGGHVEGNTISYADGTTFVAAPASVDSVSQCVSGEFCMWSLSGFSGSFTYVTGVSVTRTLGGTLGSLYNNRVNAARLYSNTGLSSTCYASREQNASVTSGYSAAEKVYLSGTTSC